MGIKYSLLLHIIVLIVLIFGMPSLKKDVVYESAITMDLVPISELTNIKQKATKNASHSAKQEPIKEEIKEQSKPQKSIETPKVEKLDPEAINLKNKQEKPKEAKKEIKADTEKNAKKQPIKPKDSKKKEEKKKEDQAKKADTLDSVLKTLKQMEHQKVDEEFKDIAKALDAKTNKPYNPNIGMSISELDSIKSQISSKWNAAAFNGADSKGMKLTVHIALDIDANVLSVTPKVENNTSAYYQAFVASCVRAVKAASPLQNLSKEKYSTWQEIEFSFDSSGMIY